jgi:response regulator of citrate/malate metabolism
VLEAVRLGVHEFLLKPVSMTALRERLAPSWRSLSL